MRSLPENTVEARPERRMDDCCAYRLRADRGETLDALHMALPAGPLFGSHVRVWTDRDDWDEAHDALRRVADRARVDLIILLCGHSDA